MPSQNKEVLRTYHYDPLDCLIGLNSAKQDTLQRFYCKSRLATEIQGLARCSIVQQGDLLLAQQKRLGDTLETALLATDRQRSVMHEVGGGSLPIAYSPYGHRRPESGLTSLLGFNGERPDAITGHYLLGNGYRAFNPVFMRFNSPDSLSPFGKGGLNSYVYCLGDPVNFSDPTGKTGKLSWFLLSADELFTASIPVRYMDKGLVEKGLYTVMSNAMAETYLYKSGKLALEKLGEVNRYVTQNSKAGKQLSKWRAPARSSDAIKNSQNIDAPYVSVEPTRLKSDYDRISSAFNQLPPPLKHVESHLLVMDDIKDSYTKMVGRNKRVEKSKRRGVLSPFDTASESYAHKKYIMEIREGT